MLGNIRRYEIQAVWALTLAAVAVAPALVATGLAMRNYNADLGRIVYGSKGVFLPAFAASVLFSLLVAFVGFALGWSSAGQPRNHRSSASWAGFFLGGLVLSANIILLLAFYLLQLRLE